MIDTSFLFFAKIQKILIACKNIKRFCFVFLIFLEKSHFIDCISGESFQLLQRKALFSFVNFSKTQRKRDLFLAFR